MEKRSATASRAAARWFGVLCLVAGAVCMMVALGAKTPTGGQAQAASGAVDYDWQPIGICGGGGMFAPAISPIDPNLMMINCDMSGAYISRDGGKHWQMINHLQLTGNTRCKPGFHPKDINTIYAASGWEGGLKVSHDGGAQWKKIGNLQEGVCGGIAFDPDYPDLMLVGGDNGGFISHDAGNTWEHCAGVTGQGISFFVDRTSPKDARAVFAATQEGVWRSDDGGRMWTKKQTGLPWTETLSFAGGADPKTGLVMLYCSVTSKVENGQFAGGVYRSRDRGEHWQSAMGNGINKDTTTADEYAEGPIAQYQHLLATNTKPLTVYALNTSTGFHPPHHPTVYRSDDGGENWRATMFADPRFQDYNVQPDWFTVSTGRTEVTCPYGAAIADSDPNRVMHLNGLCYITADGGHYWYAAHALPVPGEQLKAGCSWQPNGLVVTTTWHHYLDPFQPNRRYIAYTDIGFARSMDAGKTWIWWSQDQWTPWVNTCYEIAFDPDTPGKMWGAFSNLHDIPNDNIISGRHGSQAPGGVCLSTNFGENWRALGTGLPVKACTSIVLDPKSPKGSRTLYVSFFDDGVYKSTDDGNTWAKKSAGLGAPENMRVYRLILHKDGTLFALITAKRQGGAYLENGVGLYRSKNGGGSWECITRSVGLLWPKDFAVSPDSSKVIFIGAADARNDQGGLWRTSDGGATWKKVAREGSEHFGAYFHPKRPNWVYMTLTEGAQGPSLWLSTDGGDDWQAIPSFPFDNAQRVEFDPKDPDVIYVTTFGGSVFKGTAKL
jgi:photosystem II stability/assembly factor-like uncharacterized protein